MSEWVEMKDDGATDDPDGWGDRYSVRISIGLVWVCIRYDMISVPFLNSVPPGLRRGGWGGGC